VLGPRPRQGANSFSSVVGGNKLWIFPPPLKGFLGRNKLAVHGISAPFQGSDDLSTSHKVIVVIRYRGKAYSGLAAFRLNGLCRRTLNLKKQRAPFTVQCLRRWVFTFQQVTAGFRSLPRPYSG
jgi:hypothetical protein